tara:strand:+ start:387 stop:581 length:195 start_codon:yes stop_codon:yes gene_type:complete
MELIVEKAEKVMRQLYKLGFKLDGSYWCSWHGKIMMMSRRGQLIEVDEDGLVCGESINEFLKTI